MNDLWVFGYASLMWKPGFDYAEKTRARLSGYHRALCIHSWEHRGTRQRPGLVMGLDRGGSCVGLAFRILPENKQDVMTYLRARELITKVYKERIGPITLDCGTRVNAVTYVADRAHEQYAGRMDISDAIAQVCGAVGDAGPNEDYVINTAEHIKSLGINDPWLASVSKGIKEFSRLKDV
ncbi:MAG: gamma-glutamylcyclotransferase [Ahrensia sp.]|nr:gamma-glutamylcyclotransferase [Ahrensia sp.]